MERREERGGRGKLSSRLFFCFGQWNPAIHPDCIIAHPFKEHRLGKYHSCPLRRILGGLQMVKLCFRRAVPLEVSAWLLFYFSSVCFFRSVLPEHVREFHRSSQHVCARAGGGGRSKGNDVTRTQTSMTHEFSPRAFMSPYITPPADPAEPSWSVRTTPRRRRSSLGADAPPSTPVSVLLALSLRIQISVFISLAPGC